MAYPAVSITRKPMMHIAFSPISQKIISFLPISAKFINFSPIFVKFTFFCVIYVFLLPAILSMMHLCSVLYTYWTPLGRCVCVYNTTVIFVMNVLNLIV